MTIASYTNSSLTCFHRCPREFDLRYVKKLSRVGEDREVLAVGTAWHKAHDAEHKAGDAKAAYEALIMHSPTDLWAEKLRRLFAAYEWHYGSESMEIESSEKMFEYHAMGKWQAGQMDGIVIINGQRGVLERKTSGEDIAPGSPYWDRLRMSSQVSMYANAFKQEYGELPAFTVYDVVKKPTIRPKAITKADAKRMRDEVNVKSSCTYFDEFFTGEELEKVIFDGQETPGFYGARLTADIGTRPGFYFQREVIYRTAKDLADAELDTFTTISMIESIGSYYPRNTASCTMFGGSNACDFIGLCSNGEYPSDTDIPAGFAKREALHPELEDLHNE